MKMLSTPCIKDYFKEEQSKSNMCKVPREMLFTSLQKGVDFFFFVFFVEFLKLECNHGWGNGKLVKNAFGLGGLNCGLIAWEGRKRSESLVTHTMDCTMFCV